MKLGIGTRCPNFIDKRTPISSHKSPYRNGFSSCTVYKASYLFLRFNATVVQKWCKPQNEVTKKKPLQQSKKECPAFVQNRTKAGYIVF